MRISLSELGLTPEQAQKEFKGLPREEALAKVEAFKAQKAKNQQTISTFTDKVNQLKDLEKDKYKSVAVGSNPFARGWGSPIQSAKNVLTGGKENFISGVNLMTNRETLDNLIRIKEAGGTFGALSEKELEMLINSATKINSWEMKDKNGEVKGYDIGEKYFNKELGRLKSLAEKAITGAGGTVPQEDDQTKKQQQRQNQGVTSTGVKYTIE